jgi:hypothetical protein
MPALRGSPWGRRTVGVGMVPGEMALRGENSVGIAAVRRPTRPSDAAALADPRHRKAGADGLGCDSIRNRILLVKYRAHG